MGLVLQLVETRADGGTRGVELRELAFTHSCTLLRDRREIGGAGPRGYSPAR